MVKVLITGGTGLVGKHLQQVFKENNIEVVVLSRNPKKENEFQWNIDEGFIDENAFEKITHIIHLAGAGIAEKRWTNKRKQELISSRVQSANLLFQKVKEYKIPLKGFISASAIGYYGAITSDKIFTEEAAPEIDFISAVCVKWENAAHQFQQLKIPVTIFRTGIVLTKQGSALQKMNTPLFLSALGNGKQYMPWIHIRDLCNMYLEAITNNNFTGVYNTVAPEHQTNEKFMKAVGANFKKPVLPINIPSFILKTALGEMADILLKGSRVSSKKVSEFYTFIFSDLNSALKNIYDNE